MGGIASARRSASSRRRPISPATSAGFDFCAMTRYHIRKRPDDPRPDAIWDQIPKEHAQRVGRLIAAYALVEFKLEAIIWRLIGASKHDLRPLTARLDARPKKEAIDELLACHAIPPEEMKAWNLAKPLLKQLSEHRNWFAHGVWVPVPIGETSVFLTRKGKAPDIIARAKPVSTTDLDLWIAEARELVRHLNMLLPDDGDAPPPQPRKPRRPIHPNRLRKAKSANGAKVKEKKAELAPQ
jgi:hypothetical protein